MVKTNRVAAVEMLRTEKHKKEIAAEKAIKEKKLTEARRKRRLKSLREKLKSPRKPPRKPKRQ